MKAMLHTVLSVSLSTPPLSSLPISWFVHYNKNYDGIQLSWYFKNKLINTYNYIHITCQHENDSSVLWLLLFFGWSILVRMPFVINLKELLIIDKGKGANTGLEDKKDYKCNKKLIRKSLSRSWFWTSLKTLAACLVIIRHSFYLYQTWN